MRHVGTESKSAIATFQKRTEPEMTDFAERDTSFQERLNNVCTLCDDIVWDSSRQACTTKILFVLSSVLISRSSISVH